MEENGDSRQRPPLNKTYSEPSLGVQHEDSAVVENIDLMDEEMPSLILVGDVDLTLHWASDDSYVIPTVPNQSIQFNFDSSNL